MRNILRYFHISKLGIYLYTILNYLLLVALVYFVEDGAIDSKTAFLGVGIIYLISFIIAISPVGEWLIRVSTGCHKITEPAIINRLNWIWQDVLDAAHEYNNCIKPRIKLFIHYDDSYNAFACGRHSICIHRGLLELSDDDIKGILSHELGHIVNKDTTFLLIASITNILTTIVIVVFEFILKIAIIVMACFSNRRDTVIVFLLVVILFYIPSKLIIKLWNFICKLLIGFSARSNEYQADYFAFEIGYGEDLKHALQLIDGHPMEVSWFEQLFMSPPATYRRIDKLNNYLY